MADAFSIKFDAARLNAKLNELAEGVQKNIRPAVQAGAQVLYEEVKLRAPMADGPHIGRNGKVYAPGTLKNAVYQAFSADHSTDGTATYHISWNKKKARHGHLIEHGHLMRFKIIKTRSGRYIQSKVPYPSPVWVAPRPFLRPAYDAKHKEALEAAKVKFGEGLQDVIAGLST